MVPGLKKIAWCRRRSWGPMTVTSRGAAQLRASQRHSDHCRSPSYIDQRPWSDGCGCVRRYWFVAAWPPRPGDRATWWRSRRVVRSVESWLLHFPTPLFVPSSYASPPRRLFKRLTWFTMNSVFRKDCFLQITETILVRWCWPMMNHRRKSVGLRTRPIGCSEWM